LKIRILNSYVLSINIYYYVTFSLSILFVGITTYAAEVENLKHHEEKHLKNIRQLSFGGENAEAYFSSDGEKLIFQSTRNGNQADQIYTMNLDGSGVRMVSTGKGRCTCSYFLPNGKIIFSSTHHYDSEPPQLPDPSKGYVWPIYPSYDVFVADENGNNLKRLTYSWGYDAEATVSPLGDKIVFTSIRDGDLDIFTINTDRSNLKKLTHSLGYEGGAFFSPNGDKIVYRAYQPKTIEKKEDFKRLLTQNLIRMSNLQIFIMDSDGRNKKQLTNNGVVNFCPFFTPDGKKIIFSSNMSDPKGRNFDLFLINIDGRGLERVTYNKEFDAFPMFSPNGKKLVWASNRNSKVRGETNIFIADWVD